jgi:ferritin
MISKNIEKAIIDQITAEEHSSRIYLSMASWCEVNGFPGAAIFLYDHADEERMHMLKLVHYLNDRGGYAISEALEQPPFEFKSLKHVFEEVLKHEIYITGRINDLVKLSMKENDFTTANFLQWYVTEQIEEESLARSILDKFNLAEGAKGGLFHIDKELESMAAAEAAGGEEA